VYEETAVLVVRQEGPFIALKMLYNNRRKAAACSDTMVTALATYLTLFRRGHLSQSESSDLRSLKFSCQGNIEG